MEICKQQCEIEMRHLPAISIYNDVGGFKRLVVRVGVRVGVENFFCD